MAGHDVAAVFDADGAFEHAFDQVAQGGDDRADKADGEPCGPGDIGHQQRADKDGHEDRHEDTEGGALPGLAGRVARPHLVLAEERASDVGAGVVDPDQGDDHQQGVLAEVGGDGGHQREGYGGIEERHHGVGRLAEGLLAAAPQLDDDRQCKEDREEAIGHQHHGEALAGRQDGGQGEHQQGADDVEVAQRAAGARALLLHHAEEFIRAPHRHEEQEGGEKQVAEGGIAGEAAAVERAEEEQHIDYGAGGADPKGFHSGRVFWLVSLVSLVLLVLLVLLESLESFGASSWGTSSQGRGP